MNKREHKHFSEYYDQETLNRVNVLLYEDFAKLSYPMISDVNKLYVNTVDTINDIKSKIKMNLKEVKEVNVEVVFDPPWEIPEDIRAMLWNINI